jgi:hypothetical protein
MVLSTVATMYQLGLSFRAGLVIGVVNTTLHHGVASKQFDRFSPIESHFELGGQHQAIVNLKRAMHGRRKPGS